jgi:alanine racemase
LDSRGDFIGSILEIDLNRLVENYNILRSKLQQDTICAAVVKANAYGVGARHITGALASVGCEDFFVANLDEALDIRHSVSDENVYVLHGVDDKETAETCTSYNIIPVISSVPQLETWYKHCKNSDEKLPMVLHIESGMGRLGLQEEDLKYINKHHHLLSNCSIRQVMSHLSCADEPDHPHNYHQLTMFKEILFDYFNYKSKASLANSSGIFLGDDYHFDMVRPGCAIYGVNPTPHQANPMKNIITLKAKVLQKRILDYDYAISYGATYKASKGDKIAILEYGYADGYFRCLSNGSYVNYLGHKLPVIGRVTMDMIIIDASALQEQEFAKMDFVELINDEITVDEIAKRAKTIGYEVLTSLSPRAKRIYKIKIG